MSDAKERIRAVEAGIWDPRGYDKLGPAWDAAVDMMWDETWYAWDEVLAEMVEAGQIMSKSAYSVLGMAINLMLMEKRGEYKRKTSKSPAQDSREVRIAKGAKKKRPDLFMH